MGNSDELYEPVLLPSPGRLLHEARITKKLGVEQISDILRLSPRVIDALEADDADNLPAAAFVRGYLRAYAKIVGVSGEQVVDAYNQLNGDGLPDFKLKKSIQTQASSHDLRMRIATFLIVGVLSVLLAFWWYTERDATYMNLQTDAVPDARLSQGQPFAPASAAKGENQPLPDAELPNTDTGASGQTALTATVSATLQGGLEQQLQSPLRQTQTPEAVLNQLATETAVAPAEADVATTATTTTTATASAVRVETKRASQSVGQGVAESGPGAPQGDHLQLEVKSDSWVEVHDAEGKRLIYDLLRGGKTVDVYGQAPFRVFLGNSVGVVVRLNGERFDHSSYNHGNLARFELGQTE